MTNRDSSQASLIGSPNQAKLGHYTLLEKIAQGGMAEIYKAKTVDPEGIERLVVIKRILQHISSQPEYVEMLIDEAKIAVHFTHGNIAQIYDLGRVNQDYFIVMEYVDGKTLSQIFRTLRDRHQKIPIDILLYCFIELSRALSYIHRKTGPSGKKLGVVHRDISPQNIILSYAGHVKLIDFGVAKADFLEEKTEAGVLKGKFAYMSPEQTYGSRLDHRSDIFPLGTLLWEMATGERLFKKKNNRDTIKAVQKAKFEWASQRRADIPQALDKIMGRCLNRLPRKRYQDAGDVATELERLLLSINPEFRPITAAKFLYDLFGPEKDERHLPPPIFVNPNLPREENTMERPSDEDSSFDSGSEVSGKKGEATVKEVFEDTTPVVKIQKPYQTPRVYAILLSVVTAIFLIGGLYVYFVSSQQRALIFLEGFDDQMTVRVDGEKIEVFESQIKVSSHESHKIQITKKDHRPFFIAVNLKPHEEKHLKVQLEKIIPPFGDIEIMTTPPGATIYVNEKEWGEKSPTVLKKLDEGQEVQIGFFLENYKFVTKAVKVIKGKVIQINQTLEINSAILKITTIPVGVQVFLGDEAKGITPLVLPDLIPGQELQLKLVAPGYVTQEYRFELKAGEEKTLTYELHPQDN